MPRFWSLSGSSLSKKIQMRIPINIQAPPKIKITTCIPVTILENWLKIKMAIVPRTAARILLVPSTSPWAFPSSPGLAKIRMALIKADQKVKVVVTPKIAKSTTATR